HDDRVLAAFHNFIEVADCPSAGGTGERAVLPDRFAATDEVAAGQVAGGQIVMAGNGDKRPPELPRHVLDKAGFSATGRTFQHNSQRAGVALLEERDFATLWDVEGF